MTKKKYRKNKFSLDETISKSKFNYCKNLKWFLIAPIAIILVGIILFSTIGFNLGLDFTGGSVLTVYSNNGGQIMQEDGVTPVKQYDLTNNSDYNEFKAVIENTLREQGVKGNIVFQTTNLNLKDIVNEDTEGQALLVKYQNIDGLSPDEITQKNIEIKEVLLQKLDYNNQVDFEKSVVLGGVITATASSELLMKAFIAMLVAIVLILIYIIIRFEITSGMAAILALFHDLFVVASLVLMFRITINSSFIAALVTILGYSINNTIIIFDRIRENIKTGKYETATNAMIANASVKETMTRSIYTTITTFITIALVAAIGVSDIRDFALPIVFGIIAGFYSSVFLTPGLWALAYRGPKKRKIKVKEEAEVRAENKEEVEVK